METKEKRIIEEINRLKDHIIDFAMRLISQPSTLGGEASALRVMEDELTRLSFSPVRVPINPEVLSEKPGFAPVPWSYENRFNLVATHSAEGQGGQSALFNGHLDVVSPEPTEMWDHDPFEPSIKEGWLYGRGAGDMKSGLAAMIYAVHAIEKAGFGLKAPVTLEAVIEEECSGNGTLACIYAGYDAEAVLIPEPFGPIILTSELGVLWFKVTVRGVPTHVATAEAGVNAIEKCYVLIRALRELEAEMNQIVHPAFRDIKHPLNFNIGIIHGGDWPSTVPAKAEFHGRVSYFPGTSFDQIGQKIVQIIELAAKNDPWLSQNTPTVEFYGFRSEGHHVKRDFPAFKVLSGCHRDLTGRDADEYSATCTTDLRAFQFFGRGQATCYGPVAKDIHGFNECVDLDSVIHIARAYALFLSRWCVITE